MSKETLAGLATYPMTDHRRQLMLMVFDGEKKALPLLYQLDPFNRCEDILRWLLRNKLTGKKFVDWVREENLNSALKTGQNVLMRLERERQTRPVLAGDDYLTRR